MGNRSGKRLSNAAKRFGKRERKKIGEKRRRNRIRITTPPIQRGYCEIYNVIKTHIVDFLKSKRQHERWSATYCVNQHYKCVIVLIGNDTMFVVDRILFEDDTLTIKIDVLGGRHQSSPGFQKSEQRYAMIGYKETWHLPHINSNRIFNREKYSCVVGDPNLINGLDVFLDKCYEKYKNHEYLDSINS